MQFSLKPIEDFIYFPPRLLLEYTGVPYENRVMVMPKPEWLEYKKSLDFDFPNLPYYQVLNYQDWIGTYFSIRKGTSS